MIGQFLAIAGIFFAAALFASGMAGAALRIRRDDVNDEAARESEGAGSEKRGYLDLFKDKRILTFTAAVVLFNVGNSATLPLVGQLLSTAKKSGAVWQIASCVVVAEIVMVAVAAFVGKRADHWGRKPIFLSAFGVLALRDALTVVNHQPWFLISLQSLDGIAAAIYGVLLTLVVADLAEGTGRFNFLQGAVQSAMALGAFLSNALFGWIAKTMGFNASFWGLAIGAAAAACSTFSKCPKQKSSKTVNPILHLRSR